jgi:hypothetical protein
LVAIVRLTKSMPAQVGRRPIERGLSVNIFFNRLGKLTADPSSQTPAAASLRRTRPIDQTALGRMDTT